MPSYATVSLPILLTILTSACASSETWNATDYGVSAVQFQDMVVPAGMRIVDDYHESHSREAAGWRFGDYSFIGKMPVQEASSYLLLRMPEHRWQLVGEERPNENTHNLQFERGRYHADYTIERVEGSTHMHVKYRTEIQ